MSALVAAAVTTAVVSVGSAYSSGSASEKQAKSQKDLNQKQIDEANRALEKLEPAKAAKAQVAQQEFKLSSESFGLKVEDANKQLGAAIQKSGLVSSAGISSKKSSMWKQFAIGEKGLIGELGKKMGGVEEWFEGEKSRLESVKTKAELGKKAAKSQEEGWYLGKNISDRRLKKEIKYLSSLKNNIRIYEFKYIWGEQKRLGVMADEVEKIIPEAVSIHSSGYKMVDYSLLWKSLV